MDNENKDKILTAPTPNMETYHRFFKNILKYETVEQAQESVEKLENLYAYFERIGDRAGQHQAMILALTGKNKARWPGKQDIAKIFSDWLASH